MPISLWILYGEVKGWEYGDIVDVWNKTCPTAKKKNFSGGEGEMPVVDGLYLTVANSNTNALSRNLYSEQNNRV